MLTLTVSGSGFLNTSVVEVGGTPEPTTYASATQLTATVPAGQLASGAEIQVVVMNGSSSSGSGTGTAINLEVDNPAPTITSISPTSGLTGVPSTVITVTGTGFVPATVINVNGAARTATFASATQISVALAAADVAAAGSLSLTAVNPTPGGGTSTAISIPVIASNPVPTISAINPTTEVVGTASRVITVTGTGFVASTVIDVNGSVRPTTFASASQVSVTLTAADVSATGSLSLTAVNPAPCGGTSAAVSLPVNNPSAGTIHLNPSTLTIGTTVPTVITVTGNGFAPSSVVQINGSARVTYYTNSTTLTFLATVADQATAATLAVTVTNLVPGVGISPPASLSVQPAVTPVITSVSPSSVLVGSPNTFLTVLGTGFTTTSVVQWNGTALATTLGYSYNGVALIATLPAADLTAVGTADVTVNTPNANQPLSNTVTVNITNPPVPTLTSLSPNAGPINQELLSP